MAKVMVSLPDDFLKKVDRHAKAQGRSRSELIREALRLVLRRKPRRGPSWAAALAPLEALERDWVGRWDSSDVIRQDRDSGHGPADRR